MLGGGAIKGDLDENAGEAPCPYAELAHSRKMYDRVSGLARIGVWECDLATEALTWTDGVYDLFDIPRGTPVLRDETLKLYEPSSRLAMERLRREAIRTGTGFSLDIRIRTSKGRERWVRLTADVEQEHGRSVRIFGTKQDISAEKAAQEKVQALQTELIHMSRVSAMSAMASTLAHEVNQPLTAIVSYMAAARRIAARERVAGGLAEAIDAAAAAARRAGEIIRRVRDMTGKGRSVERSASMEDVILEAVALATAGRPEMAITYDLAPDAPVLADRIQIQQVLINLLKNAREASAAPCRIEIATALRDTHLEVRVSDRGAGIPAAILPEIFESFVTSKPQGSGIGLSISRTIVEAHGGHIRAANRPGGGASIVFTLPLAK